VGSRTFVPFGTGRISGNPQAQFGWMSQTLGVILGLKDIR